LDQGIDQYDQLLKVAADHARDIHALCADVAAVIFPSAIVPPTEASINAASAKLRQIVSDIEAVMCPRESGEPPLTWQILARAGFLRDPDLIDFILARVAEDRLEAMVESEEARLPTLLLDHTESTVADAAQTLLAAQSLHQYTLGNAYLTLTPELLHKLCWRVAAALEVVHGARRPEVVAAARDIIAGYSEANRAQAAARKILHFSTDAERSAYLDPAVSGVQLHVAAMSAALDLDQDHVLRLIEAGSCAPYAIMFAATGTPKRDAIDAIYLFRKQALTLREAGIIDAGYDTLDSSNARSEVQKWAVARSNFLAFGQP
jgi:hypothetical protein